MQFNPRRVQLWLAESSGEALIELGARKAVILRPAGLDLDRAHERCNMSGGPPVEPVQESVDEPGAERIAATGRVHHLAHRRRGNQDLLPARMDDGARRP